MIASFVRHGLGGNELKSEVLETLIAGSDTTAGALRGTMLYLMGNKRVCERLQVEIDQAVREGRVDGTGEEVVPFAVAKQLPYLQAVIREGLRVWPPVRNILPKDIPAGGDTVMVDGKPVFLPGGVEIGYSALAMHRDKKVYGEDADLFRPERWFEKDPEKLAVMTKVNDLTFGHGRWQCLGKNVAQMELNKALFEVSVESSLPSDLDNSPHPQPRSSRTFLPALDIEVPTFPMSPALPKGQMAQWGEFGPTASNARIAPLIQERSPVRVRSKTPFGFSYPATRSRNRGGG